MGDGDDCDDDDKNDKNNYNNIYMNGRRRIMTRNKRES